MPPSEKSDRQRAALMRPGVQADLRKAVKRAQECMEDDEIYDFVVHGLLYSGEEEEAPRVGSR